ncbi:hypothetical protein [Erythrobacter sp. THAF29]|uniref:hypothetical protein n=1 Tax=Erythrobacter sp. THAF29 TaxID=2587851 RepID=UPI0012A9D59E|nr:hypothetical protein [Erythrobacter sp. THAF29]QFT78507.1 hypothetical protein FIU90_13225 [Erythrobacter sp. THAF29]
MTDAIDNGPDIGGKKAWQKLKLEQLDVPSATRTGFGRLQPGEAFNFYRNS